MHAFWATTETADEHIATLVNSYPAPGCHFWFGVQPMDVPPSHGRGKSADVSRVTTLYADLDFAHEHKPLGMSPDAALQFIDELTDMLGMPPSAIVNSGYGLQPYWPITGVEPAIGAMLLLRWRSLLIMVAARLGVSIDTGVYDLPRILRIPGPPNVKYGASKPTALVIPGNSPHDPILTADILTTVFDSYLPKQAEFTYSGVHASGVPRLARNSDGADRVFTTQQALDHIETYALTPARETPWASGSDYWKVIWQCALVCAAFREMFDESDLKDMLRKAILDGHGAPANEADEYQIALGFIKHGDWVARLPTEAEENNPFSPHCTLKPSRVAEVREQYDIPADVPLVTEYVIETPAEAATSTAQGLVLVWGSEIEEEGTEWLWEYNDESWLPLGELVLLGGREGIGKSTWTARLIAQVTNGTMHGKHLGVPKRVIVCATEDSWSKTLMPRFKAAGADCSRIARADVRQDALMRGLRLPTDIVAVEKAVREHEVAMIVLDPLLSTVEGKLDTHKDSDVRQALDPLTRLAHDCEITIIGLIHQNKSTSGDLMTRMMGSRAFGAVARTVLVCHEMKDKDEPSDALLAEVDSGKPSSDKKPRSFLFGQIKNNLGARVETSIRYEIQGVDRGVDKKGTRIRTAKIKVADYSHAEGVEDNVMSSEKAAAAKTDRRRSPDGNAFERCKAAIHLALLDGPKTSVELKAITKDHGFSEATHRKAAGDMDLEKAGVIPNLIYSLPTHAPGALAQ